MANWNIGCSGFHYKHWKGTFYPENLAQTKWFAYYCQFFNTLELNVTFYRFPRAHVLQTWHEKSPANFRFAVKAYRGITHYKKFNGTTKLIADFYKIVQDGLGGKLGCILFQLPPNFHYSTEHLERIVNSLDNSLFNVVEFRHESWWNEEVYRALTNKNIAFCGMSHPTLPNQVVINASLLYYRLHGEGQLYASNYTDEQLSTFVAEIKSKPSLSDVYVFFNNDINTYAIHNAQKMLKMI